MLAQQLDGTDGVLRGDAVRGDTRQDVGHSRRFIAAGPLDYSVGRSDEAPGLVENLEELGRQDQAGGGEA